MTAVPSIRLVCLDVDGTMMGASLQVHPAVTAAMARARDAGIRLAVCSGRPGFGVTRDLAAAVDPAGLHCFQNGASVIDFGSGRSLSSALEPAAVQMLVARARGAGRLLELYTDEGYAAECDDERLRRHAALLGLDFAPRGFDTLTGTCVRAQWLLPHAETPAVLAESYPGLEVSPSLAPSMPDTTFVSITRAGVNKGSAVRTIADSYGVALENVMYVGDGFNDAPAMRLVGWPVAVEHSEPEARALARTFIPGPDEAGVAMALDMARESQA